MLAMETAELSLEQRGILASSASAAYLDRFSEEDRRSISVYQRPTLTTRTRKYSSRGQEFTIKWQDYGEPLPSWFDAVMQGFVDLLTLPPNWDSYGAGVIDPDLVRSAMTFANEMLGPRSPAPRVVPLSSGGLQLEWQREGIDLEIIFDRGEVPFFSYRNRTSGEEGDHDLATESHLLRAILAKLG